MKTSSAYWEFYYNNWSGFKVYLKLNNKIVFEMFDIGSQGIITIHMIIMLNDGVFKEKHTWLGTGTVSRVSLPKHNFGLIG